MKEEIRNIIDKKMFDAERNSLIAKEKVRSTAIDILKIPCKRKNRLMS